jgi:Mg2+ and Co2+ transporter CorA
MNVAFPLAGSLAGFWLVLVLLVGVAVALYVGFRRRDWL